MRPGADSRVNRRCSPLISNNPFSVLSDGKSSPVGKLTHTCTLNLTIDQHQEELTFQVTKLAGWDLIVGKPWLRKHNPAIDWARNTCNFVSGYCQAHCLPTRKDTSGTVISTPQASHQDRIAMISRAAFRVAMARTGA